MAMHCIVCQMEVQSWNSLRKESLQNMAASVLTRLKNQAKADNIAFQMVLQLFAQEEFLRKLSESDYSENMILKGGMFIYTLTEFDSRPTRDIDFLLRNIQGDLENIEDTMKKSVRLILEMIS